MLILEKIKSGRDLSFEEATDMFDQMLSGTIDELLAEAILLALAEKGESEEEIAGSAQAMIGHAIPVNHKHDTLLDIVGTGGDNSGSFNISTAAAIVCSTFVPVAKHGNRAVSSKSGSADVLEALGIPIELNKDEAAEYLKKNNFVFLFAQKYHPSMKSIAPVRKRLGRRTIFNLLGPLCNPAHPNCQVIGLFRNDFLPRYMAAIQHLNIPNAMVVSSYDGLDEVSISDKTRCCYKKEDSLEVFDFDPKEFGIYADKASVRGYEAATNADMMREMFIGQNHAALTDVVALNAAFGLKVSGVESDLRQAFTLAKETIRSGKVYDKLQELTA
ncbi:MAG TPA: anthranilate phosphoribosyltransferase [Syntrophorhabdaceae bacterium]|nr:anthranilate phosphoribosyltransferase [Syntrophorhabdaceae bacterium]